MSAAAFLLLITLAAFAVAAWRLSVRLKPLFSAAPSHRTQDLIKRFKFAVPEVVLHRRLLKFRLSGVIHLLVFFSFIVLLSAIVQAYAKVWAPAFSGFSGFAMLQDMFAVLMLIGVALALYNRLITKPERLEGSNKPDAYITLGLISIIVVAMLLEFAFHIVAVGANVPYHPVAGWMAVPFASMSLTSAQSAASIFFWLHIFAILAFLVYLPGSKHLHMFAGIPNIVFRNKEPPGKLPSDVLAVAPAAIVQDMPWKDMLDLYSCTECGRCQSVCPAHAAGLPLSPKTLIMDLRDQLVISQKMPGTDNPPALAGEVISSETLWACTTCGSCMEVCPLHIEHVPKIVNMRRTLVDAGAVSKPLQDTLVSFTNYGNSFKKPPRARPKWTRKLDFKIPDASKEPVEFLWYVGDYASYHPVVQNQTRNIANLLHSAGISFGILYDKEKNSGNDVRRMGEEGLFQSLVEENIAAINAADYQRIFTTDPHTLNSLTNEYQDFGLEADVIHYTQLLFELMSTGNIAFSKQGTGKLATYHDPCYLGRYNGKYDAPRDIIRMLGFELHEMPRNRENSFCCGAGGGRIFMDDTSPGERPSESRIREAMDIGGVGYFVVSCPKDVVMYRAAVENLEVGDEISVCEMSELFHLES